MDLHRDFEEMLSALSSANVRFLVVGAFAVAHHTEPRYTKDIDLWIDPSPDNAARVWEALAKFGAPLRGMEPGDFEHPNLVYQLGIEPVRIDVLTGIDGCSFARAWKRREPALLGRVRVYYLGRTDLIAAKRAAGRPQDLLDLQRLNVRGSPRTKRQKPAARRRR